MPPPTLLNEKERLVNLEGLQILDTLPEQPFEDLIDLLVRLTDCPVALFAFVDNNRVWFKASRGVPFGELPREATFCTHTIAGDGLLVVNDTLADPRFVSNPFVVGSKGIRFYAGAPVLSPDGHNVGSVCVLDVVPRPFSADVESAITAIARQASVLLELRDRNLKLARLAEEKLSLEKATLQRQMELHEAERELIGYELHENFAQTIAAALQYLSMVRAEEDSLDYLKQVRTILTGLLNGVRRLSAAVFPIGSAGAVHEEMFEQFIRQLDKPGGLTVSYGSAGDMSQVSPIKLLTLFRIMVEQLHSYQLQGHAGKQVEVRLEVGEDVCMRISVDGVTGADANLQDKVVENAILKRSQFQNGRVIRAVDHRENEVLTVHLPL